MMTNQDTRVLITMHDGTEQVYGVDIHDPVEALRTCKAFLDRIGQFYESVSVMVGEGV